MVSSYKYKYLNGTKYLSSQPIEYKTVELDDFIECKYIAKKQMLKPDSEGYLDKSILEAIDIKKPYLSKSYQSRRNVSYIIAEAFPNTLILDLASIDLVAS
jgi:hypothetical protein